MSNNYKSILQTNSTELSSNNSDLLNLINQINALPDAGGVELPELTNEGSAADLLSGKQLIAGDGNVVTGNFSIDIELNRQDDLISQIQTALQGKASGGSDGGSVNTCTVTLKSVSLTIQKCYSTHFTDTTGVYYQAETNNLSVTRHTLYNVVCGSLITVRTIKPTMAGHSTTGGAELVNIENNVMWVFSIPQTPSGEITITMRDDD